MTTKTQATASQPSRERRRSVARVVRAASRSWPMVSAWLGAGEVEPEAVAALQADLAEAAARHDPTELALDAVTPGPPRRPRMIWATAKPSPGYTAVVNDVAAAAAPHAPNARPARRGTPHLTL